MTITILEPQPTITPRDNDARRSWLESRRTGLGGSDIAAVLGLSPFATPHDVWLDKLGKAPQQEETEAMKWGIYNEEAAARRYADTHGVPLTKGGFIRDMEHPYLCGTPDYIDTANNVLVEIKCPASWTIKSWNGELPVYYWAQMQHYMYLTGMRNAVLVTYSDGRMYKEWPVTYDEQWYLATRERLHEWWITHIIGLVEPERTDLPPTADPNADALVADDNLARVYADLVEMRELEERIGDRIDELREQIRTAMGTSTTLMVNGCVAVKWEERTTTRFDTNAFKAAHPELYTQYAQTLTQRAFVIKEPRQ